MSQEAHDSPALFDAIAARYDRFVSLITFGQHPHWMRTAAAAAQPGPSDLVLDVAAGPGPLAQALAHQGAAVVALDLSAPMVALGHDRARGKPICYVRGDALHLPFPAAVFNAATIGLGLRHVPSRAAVFAEMARVVRPEGRVVVLESSQPPGPVVHTLFHSYLRLLHLLAGVDREREMYRGMVDDLATFPPAEEIAEELRAAGLREVTFRRLFLGIVAVHVGTVRA